MGKNKNQTLTFSHKMNSLSKIAFAAILGLAQAQAVEDKFRELSSHTAGRNLKGLFDKGDAYYLGKCVVKNADGDKKGIVKFHQELTDAGELEPTSVSARVRGAGADRVSIGIYETDPNTLTGMTRWPTSASSDPTRVTWSACSASTTTMSPSTALTASRVSSLDSAASSPAPLSA